MRNALHALSAGLVLTSPVTAAVAHEWIFPPALRRGDTIALVAPAGSVADEDAGVWVRGLEERGFHVRLPENIAARRYDFAGDEAERSRALMEAWLDPQVTAVWCITGGYGSLRLLDRLDYDAIRAHPKIFIGMSDITALHSAIQRNTGLVTFLGPTTDWPIFRQDPGPCAYAETWLWRPIRDDLFRDPTGALLPPGFLYAPPAAPHDPQQAEADQAPPAPIVRGVARGRLVGGNLTLIASLVGTPYQPETEGRLLVLEDVGERPYRIDRMLRQLKQAGMLDRCAGVILGQFHNCDNSENSSKQLRLQGVFDDYFRRAPYPVIQNFPTGHVPEQVTLPLGCMAQLDGHTGTLRLLENPVTLRPPAPVPAPAPALALSPHPSATPLSPHPPATPLRGMGARPRGFLFPPALKPGDTVALVAPAGDVADTDTAPIVQMLEDNGFHALLASNLGERWHDLAGNDASRARAFMQAWLDPSVSAVWCITGGYGTTRLLDRLDYDALRAHPKILMGMSDITGLHCAIGRRTGLVTFLGPNAHWPIVRDEGGPCLYAERWVWRAVRDDLFHDPTGALLPAGYTYEYPTAPRDPGQDEADQAPPATLVPGVARGRLVGGNLSLVAALVGTPYQPETEGRLLVLEDVGEDQEHLDDMLCHLRLAGMLDNCAGVILGTWHHCGSNRQTLPLDVLLRDHFGDAPYPVMINFPTGHVPEQAMLPLNCLAELDATACRLTLLENPVTPSSGDRE